MIGAVAATIQQLRMRDADPLGVFYPHATVLDPRDYSGQGQGFNDPVLWLAILRAARREDLERWDDRNERVRRLIARDFCTSQGGNISKEDISVQLAVRLECLVSILAKKLPKPEFVDGDLEQVEDWPRELLRALFN